MIASFGSRLVKFVMKRIKGLRAPGQGVCVLWIRLTEKKIRISVWIFRLTESTTIIGPAAGRIIRSLNMPFRPVIFADGQYAIFDDMAGFKVRTYI